MGPHLTMWKFCILLNQTMPLGGKHGHTFSNWAANTLPHGNENMLLFSQPTSQQQGTSAVQVRDTPSPVTLDADETRWCP